MRFRSTVALILACVLAACGQDAPFPQTDAFNRVVEAGASDAPSVFSLTVLPRKEAGKIYLFCRLKNISGHVVRIDEAKLPWSTLGLITVIAFDARGKQLRTNQSMGGIFSEGIFHDLKPSDEVSGQIDLIAFLYPTERPTFGDVELRWAYLPELENSQTSQRALTGKTLLRKELR